MGRFTKRIYPGRMSWSAVKLSHTENSVKCYPNSLKRFFAVQTTTRTMSPHCGSNTTCAIKRDGHAAFLIIWGQEKLGKKSVKTLIENVSTKAEILGSSLIQLMTLLNTRFNGLTIRLV